MSSSDHGLVGLLEDTPVLGNDAGGAGAAMTPVAQHRDVFRGRAHTSSDPLGGSKTGNTGAKECDFVGHEDVDTRVATGKVSQTRDVAGLADDREALATVQQSAYPGERGRRPITRRRASDDLLPATARMRNRTQRRVDHLYGARNRPARSRGDAGRRLRSYLRKRP